MDHKLVAKRSLNRLRSRVVNPYARRTKLSRPPSSYKATRNKAVGKKFDRNKTTAKQKKPTPQLTPEIRRKAFAEAAKNIIESDDDTLVLQEDIEFDDEKGRLLQQSTLKPAPSVVEIREPDPIPPNSVSNIKQIVRIVKNPPPTGKSISIGTQARPKSVSIGIQVGEPSKELRKPSIPSIVAPGPEPPLRAYWTHKVNLPYPPHQVAPIAHQENQQHQL